MTNEEIKALIKASRDWAAGLPKHPKEDAISERLQDFFSRQDALLLRAYAAAASQPKPKRFGAIQSMTRGYLFDASDPIPASKPDYPPPCGLLWSRAYSAEYMVFVEHDTSWVPLTEATAPAHAFMRSCAGKFAQYTASYYKGNKRYSRRVFSGGFMWIEPEQIAKWYPRAVKRCEPGRRVVGFVEETP